MASFDPEKLLRAATGPLYPKKTPQPEAAPGVAYATFNRRMWAQTIDSFLVVLLLAPPIEWIASWMFGPMPPIDTQALMEMLMTQGLRPVIDALSASGLIMRWLAGSVVELGVLGVLTVLFWDYFSATPGKMLLRLAVLDARTLHTISNRQAMVRFFAYFASTIPFLIGFFWVVVSRRRQAWHDLIAHTVVVVVPKGKIAEEIS